MTDSPDIPAPGPPTPAPAGPAPSAWSLAPWARWALATSVAVPVLAIAAGVASAATGLLVMLPAVGAVLLVGRRERTADADDPAGPLMAPPVLLLLTVSAAAVGAVLTWFLTGDGVGPVGAVLAAALVVLGAGQVLGAFRGRSLLLLPLGVLLAVPLVMAATGGQRLQLGSDNPRRIDGTDGRTVVLGAGAAPVIIPAAIAPARLTVRKVAGNIDIRVDPRLPVDLTVVGRSTVVASDGTWRASGGSVMSRRHVVMAGAGPAHQPLVLRVEAGFGQAVVQHWITPPGTTAGSSDARAQRRAELGAQRAAIAADVTARRRLLTRERATLGRLQALYAARLRRVEAASPAVPAAVLRVPEYRWMQATADGTWPGTIDPALADLTALRRTRYDLLRAAWRVNSVQAGIARRQRDLRALDRAMRKDVP